MYDVVRGKRCRMMQICLTESVGFPSLNYLTTPPLTTPLWPAFHHSITSPPPPLASPQPPLASPLVLSRSPPCTSDWQGGVHLITTYFNCTNRSNCTSARTREQLTALEFNLKNPYINCVHLLTEGADAHALPANPKLRAIPVSSQPKHGTVWFRSRHNLVCAVRRNFSTYQ